mmetsp:Transcript_22121/g.29566  ORF Transcript_22121/g.29566 Transcript_22121/m.29566 type:complete len:97 (-) Transcript_22121:919-1209(-)
MAPIRFLHTPHFAIELVIELVLFFFLLVFIDGCEGLRAEHCLRTVELFQLENELVDFLSAAPDVPLRVVCLQVLLVQFFLQHSDLLIFILYLVFFH